jgi:Uma2 family endonuclease
MAVQPSTTPMTLADQSDTPFFHYYDNHLTKEDLMGESTAQAKLIFYLLQVLNWLYRAENWFVTNDLNLYRVKKRFAYPIAPDIAVFKNVVITNWADRDLRSWRLYEPDRPPPQVVFEICSDTTWKDDIYTKPARYARLGVQEYYAYDPNDPPYVPQEKGRLRGWHMLNGSAIEQSPDTQSRLWSPELDSYLIPDGAYLRLYDQAGSMRLTESEAERAAKEAERAAKEAERAAKEAERAAKEAERAAKERAWAKLRQLGIDPAELDAEE